MWLTLWKNLFFILHLKHNILTSASSIDFLVFLKRCPFIIMDRLSGHIIFFTSYSMVRGLFSVDDQQFHLSKGDIFLVRPDMIHRYISDANAPWSYCWLAIKGPVVSDFLEKTPFANNVHVIQSHHFSTYIDIIQNTLQIRDANPSSELKLTSLCLDFFNKLMTDDFISSKEKVLTYQKLPVNTMTYLLNNYTDDIKVSDISDHMFVNRSHLSRVFKSYYNTTIQNALQQIRSMLQPICFIRHTNLFLIFRSPLALILRLSSIVPLKN